MSFRLLVSVGVAAAALASAVPVSAAEVRAFDAKVFATAQTQGRPILVDVHADWCPVCRRQAPIIAEIARSPKYRELLILKLNFDEQKSEWRKLDVRRQSTLIAYRGRTERGRLVAITDPEAIRRLAQSTMD